MDQITALTRNVSSIERLIGSIDKISAGVGVVSRVMTSGSFSGLGRTFSDFSKSAAKYNENMKNLASISVKANEINSMLAKANANPLILKGLKETLASGLGGANTKIIQKSIMEMSKHEKDIITSQKLQQNILAQQSALRAKLVTPGLSVTQQRVIQTKITDLGIKRVQARAAERKSGRALTRAAGRGKGAATSTLGKAAAATRGAAALAGIGTAASLAAGTVSVAFVAAGFTIYKFTKALSDSIGIINKFSHYSIGGMSAAFEIQLRDMRRDINLSRNLGSSMMGFSRAVSDMRDSFVSFNRVTAKLTLAMGTFAARIGENIGKNVIEPLARGLEKFLASLGLIPSEAEELAAAKAQIARRKAFFRGGNVALQGGDLHPHELNIMKLLGRNVPNIGAAPKAFQPKPLDETLKVLIGGVINEGVDKLTNYLSDNFSLQQLANNVIDPKMQEFITSGPKIIVDALLQFFGQKPIFNIPAAPPPNQPAAGNQPPQRAAPNDWFHFLGLDRIPFP
jgi:hypothetical protein